MQVWGSLGFEVAREAGRQNQLAAGENFEISDVKKHDRKGKIVLKLLKLYKINEHCGKQI